VAFALEKPPHRGEISVENKIVSHDRAVGTE